MSAAPKETILVACGHCQAGNRVPQERLGDAPKCGKCGVALLEGRPIELDAQTFDPFVSRTALPVLVDYWAPWCGPCRAMAPAFERAAAEVATSAHLVKVNTEDSPALAQRAGIRAIPTLVLYRDGRELDRVSGAQDAGTLVKWLRDRLGRNA